MTINTNKPPVSPDQIRTDLIGWLGAVSLLSEDEEIAQRFQFDMDMNSSKEMTRAKKHAADNGIDEPERAFRIYQDTCTAISTQAIINMMNSNGDGVTPPSQTVVANMIEKSQQKVLAMHERNDEKVLSYAKR